MIPPNHPQRLELNDEVHARPSDSLEAPLRLSYLALAADREQSERSWQSVCDLAQRYAAQPPPAGANHYSADFGAFRLRWERHTEFVRYTFIAPAGTRDPFAVPATSEIPADWLAALPGEVLVATHAALLEDREGMLTYPEVAERYFAGNVLFGSDISGGAATALTDLRIQIDGFSRLAVLDHSMTPWQAGRVMQRLLEIDTYRVLALLALPVARELTPFLNACERELAQITASLVGAKEAEEPKLLDRLTELSASIARRQSAPVGPQGGGTAGTVYVDNLFRFSAAFAYYELVRRRIGELRETRIQGLQTLQEFTERRLAPAMATARTVAARQDSLSQRVARATQLLSTRVGITNERQNQALLESMNRRASLQLRLQETVETVSIAAVTYYVVSLLGYVAKTLQHYGIVPASLEPEVFTGLGIPVVAFLAWLAGQRIRRMVSQEA
jgi:uncharacterized membrane-anchored protein